MKTIEILKKAIATKDEDLVEESLYSNLSTDEACINLLIEIFDQDWHHSHEDIAITFQEAKCKKAVDVLLKVATMKFEYLDYNDSESLNRKCTWALADIGSNEAKEALIQISNNSNPTISGFAQKRIDNWEKELSRKGK
jgi:hypothetical protein